MNVTELVAGLSDPGAWPRPPRRVDVAQTHASVVFLGGDEVFKLKKAVDFGFLDFSTLEKRRLACEAEVRLNRRLAPEVYLGVVPVTEGPRFGGDGPALEWAVHMKRLPADAHFRALLDRGELDPELLARFARLLAGFFEGADAGPRVQEAARFPEVERNCLENFEQAERQVGRTLTRPLLDRFAAAMRAELDARAALLDERAARGLARDGHGDLRLDHAYLLGGDELVVLDCIEFNERFRFQDPVCDLAFFVMELEFAGRADLARGFSEAFFEASGDDEGRDLLPLFIAYRHAVRGKVRGLEAAEAEVPEAGRDRAAATARAHWLAGLSALCAPAERPALVLVGGSPACGKSTLSRGLAASADFERVSSDETRKRLAGRPPTSSLAAPFASGPYSPEWHDRTYAECLRLARLLLEDGRRVVVDASFREDARRLPFVELASELHLPMLWLELELGAAQARERLLARGADPSDADLEVQRLARASWEPPSAPTAAARRSLDAAGTPEATLEGALSVLREAGLT